MEHGKSQGTGTPPRVQEGFSRRELLRLLAATTAGVALASSTERLARALTSSSNPPRLIWFNEGGNDLNLLGLLGEEVPGFMELARLQWNVRAYEALMPTGFPAGKAEPDSAPVVVLETYPAHGAEGDAVWEGLAQTLHLAKAAILAGTDACYGGIRFTAQEVHRMEVLCRQTKTPLIKLPGVPTPPHHLVGVLSYLEYFGFPRLDGHRRPLLYYGHTVCESCERRVDLDAGRYAMHAGEEGCLLRLGCKGLVTHNSCSTARWNGGENWCVGAGGPCTGCSEPDYPDHGGLGLYGRMPGDARGAQSLLWEHAEGIGYGVLALAGAGVALQTARRFLFPDSGSSASRPARHKDERR